MNEPISHQYRILIVDDNESIHTDFREILGSQLAAKTSDLERDIFDDVAPAETGGITFDLECAFGGEKGLDLCIQERARNKPFNVAFVDMRMPGWDGLKTIEELFLADPHIQVVLCTAYSDLAWATIESRIGNTDRFLILKKPFDRVEVRQLARALCHKWEVERRQAAQLESLEDAVKLRTLELERLNSSLRDEIEHRKKLEAQFRHSATHDPLTGLPNRTLLADRVGRCMERCVRHPESTFAILYLDLDGFKAVNDNLGHRCGDDLLIRVAERLTRCLRSLDTAVKLEPVQDGGSISSRIGGDEFVILLDDLNTTENAQTVGDRILRVLSEPYHLADREVTLGCSIGIAMYSKTYQAVDEILRDADMAMYSAKQSDQGKIVLFNPDLQADSTARFDLEIEVRRALKQDEFTVCYQPIVSLHDGSVYAFEALTRWHHPSRGMIPPGEFIPLAQELGLIHRIGEMVLYKACQQLADWMGRFPVTQNTVISVNASSQEFASPGFADIIDSALRNAGLPAKHLHIEIIESALMEDLVEVKRNLERVRAMGVGLSLDDFGIGYSSLGYLHTLPISTLKLDQSFIHRLHPKQDGVAIISAIIQIARHRGLTVIAEGVETIEELAQLKTVDCDYAQGYFICRPQEPAGIDKWLAGHRDWLGTVQGFLKAS